jgi:SIT4-associating protein SAP185/190
LEVQNASDDDGFEEVTHAADLGDDAKDDFDEKAEPGEDLLTPTNHSIPLSFMEKDDEEFVDEPLSSPRLKTEELDHSHHLEDPEMAVLPLSPTKELSNQVDTLDLKEEDTAMTSPPPLIDAHAEDSGPSSGPSTDSPPQAEGEKPTEPETSEPKQVVDSLDTLAHPEDKPAPLFAKKAEPSPEAILPTPIPEAATSVESLDTTMGEAGDSTNSIMMGNTDEHSQQTPPEDTPTTPVVGDFLKMQFVEHKVVPTILVSENIRD